MDIQHEVSAKLATYLANKKEVSEREYALLTYTIEVFLNEILKLFIAIVIGIIIGELPLVICTSVFLLIIRNTAGGYHFESNILCILYSLLAIVALPLLGKRVEIPISIVILLIVMEILAFLFLMEKKISQKLLVLFIYISGIVIAYLLGGTALARAMVMMIITVSVTLREKSVEN